MRCRGCQTSAAPFELVDHKGEGKDATGVCMKCLHLDRNYLKAALIHLIGSCQSNLFDEHGMLSIRSCDVDRAKEMAGL